MPTLYDLTFQSTPSAWRETWIECRRRSRNNISIHSLRMEGDTLNLILSILPTPFQSTPSAWRETWHSLQCPASGLPFQSTPSAWRETRVISHFRGLALFQSTPSAWRETMARLPDVTSATHFNPLPPHGGRQCQIHPTRIGCIISIHSLRMEGDLYLDSICNAIPHFNPLPPHGGRQK